MQLIVSLKNPPAGANKWQIVVADWNLSSALNWGVIEHDNITQSATFDIPADWTFPLRVMIGIYYQWQEGEDWYARQLYALNSLWQDEPDYVPVFVPTPGSYYFNCATNQFEPTVPVAEPTFSDFEIKDFASLTEIKMTGTYTEITEIVAPSGAVAGSTVNVEVKIKNRYSASMHIYCVAVLDSETRFIDWLDSWVSPGQTKSFYGSFVMPSKNVTINAYSYYEAEDGYLYRDDSKSKNVALAEPAPEFDSFLVADYSKGG